MELSDDMPRPMSSSEGRVVLGGDAAHPMVMYRGEGANHAIIDVGRLMEHICRLTHDGTTEDEQKVKDAISEYGAEMIDCTEVAVQAGRRACLDAHDFERIDDTSPLVRRRMMRANMEELQQGIPTL